MLRDESSSLRPRMWALPDEPLGPRVLIPGFREATAVRGAFGWFTAGWVAKLAPGLATYLNRGGVAPIDFVVAPALYESERRALTGAVRDPEFAAQQVADVFTDGRVDASALALHALDCLAWMVATGNLTLRVAVPGPTSNYHPKIWLFDDGCDRVAVRGSANATGRGVGGGVEHMDVDVSWVDFSNERVKSTTRLLDQYARAASAGIAAVYDLPDAVAAGILTTAPETAPGEGDYIDAAKADGHPRWAVTLDMTAPSLVPGRTRRPSHLGIPDGLRWMQPPYDHQGAAVAAWESSDVGDAERGVLAMATGAGKTITALICATRAQDRRPDKPLLIVVSAPSSPLLRQWQDTVAEFGVTASVPTLDKGTTTEALTAALRRLGRGGTHILIVTNNLLSTSPFQRAVEQAARGVNATTMLIGDEAHTLGAEGFMSNVPAFFELRLGLSATPERQYDPDGTQRIFDYFGDTVFEFGLADAIGFCLVPYNYHVHATTLGHEELDDYLELSMKIGAIIGKGAGFDDEDLTSLLIRRRRIVETATAKLSLLRQVLALRGPRQLHHVLIYASSKNPEQYDAVKKLLDELDVIYAEVTEHQTSDPNKLEATLEAFARGDIKVLVAKKVLDEGVDIPAIREAFLVASSTVEREWVQRRGRILRRDDAGGKTHAVLHDLLALPPAHDVESYQAPSIKRVIANELGRAQTFAQHAANGVGEEGAIATIARVRGAYWPTRDHDDLILQKVGDSFTAPDTPSGAL